MASFWKIYTPGEKVEAGNVQGAQNSGCEESEDAELEKLARRATESARQSFRQINAAKAAACKKQLLQEMKDARCSSPDTWPQAYRYFLQDVEAPGD